MSDERKIRKLQRDIREATNLRKQFTKEMGELDHYIKQKEEKLEELQ
jgi:predicted  nucleic acid-binding Zn-ribbon protein